MMHGYPFPFTAIVGQEEFKKALLLSVVDPSIGGVLAIGDRGAGKTTLIRSLAQLLDGERGSFPFVNLPLGASEDRVLGHVHLEKLLRSKEEKIRPGLLAQAHRGILYVDEVNLLGDYLMDVLLDASASGSYYLEREGLSEHFDSRFILIGSMNPEEGKLRPQLRDRFGFCVEVKSPLSKEERLQIIENRMAFDHDPKAFTAQHQTELKALKKQIYAARETLDSVKISKEHLSHSVSLALAHRVEGMRADILLIRAARALAAYQGKGEVSLEDIDQVAPLVLRHRSSEQGSEKKPKPPSTPTPPQRTDNGPDREKEERHGPSGTPHLESLSPEASLSVKGEDSSRKGEEGPLAFGSFRTSPQKTAQEKVDLRKTVGQYVASDRLEIKKKYESTLTSPKLVFLIDASGSMRKDKAVAYAKGLVEKTLAERQKMDFALIAIHHSGAEVLQGWTQDTQALSQALEELPIGGKTNIIAGFELLEGLLHPERRSHVQVALITDGRFNTGAEGDVFEESVRYCQEKVSAFGRMLVVDSEQGRVRLGLARTFAQRIGADCQSLNQEAHAG